MQSAHTSRSIPLDASHANTPYAHINCTYVYGVHLYVFINENHCWPWLIRTSRLYCLRGLLARILAPLLRWGPWPPRFITLQLCKRGVFKRSTKLGILPHFHCIHILLMETVCMYCVYMVHTTPFHIASFRLKLREDQPVVALFRRTFYSLFYSLSH